MEVTNCKDINENTITNIQLNDDGTVWAVLEVDGVESTSKLSHDCCVNNGYTFDPTDAKCYWADTCATDSYKIILDPEGNTGALFQVDENQVGECTLEVELDFLLKFDCANINDSLKNIIENLQFELSLEKVVYDESLPIPDNLESVYKLPMIDAPNIATYLDGNTNTGLTLVGTGCDALIQNLITDLGPTDSQTLNSTSFASTWVNFKMVIDDESVLESIYNEYLKIAIITNDLSNFSILIDNIKLNRLCTSTTGEVFLKDECPRFDLNRVIDNKKSWVGKTVLENRDFDLSKRLTNYNINHEKLSINAKEVDLLIKPSIAIENNVFDFIKENPCLLSPATGCTSGTTGTTSCVDINALLTVPITELVDSDGLMSQLIDVKSRKVISSYPTIELVYNRYINSYEHCGVVSDSLSSESVDSFIDLIGGFWSDLIEQVVPATTIWGTSHQFSNSVVTSSFSKYRYRKSTTLLATSLNFAAPSPVSGTTNPLVDIITEDITDTAYFGPPEFAPPMVTQSSSGVSIIQKEDSSEFIGTVTVIGGTGGEGGEGELTGNTITINETISDTCNTYNNASACN
jgi:hypothetical protein